MTADMVLAEAARTVADRRALYGEPAEAMAALATRWSLTLGRKVTPAEAVLCLIDLKLVRLAKNPRHHDSLVDPRRLCRDPWRDHPMTTRRKTPKAPRAGRPAALRRLTTREVTERDPDGVRVIHHRVVDTLGRMREAGTISPEMHDAARDFQAAFTIAHLDRMPSASLVLVQPPGTRGSGDLTDAQVGARERVARALDALGGIGSPAGSCIWHIVGLQCSIREWALRQGWSGRPVKHEQAQGMLVAALGVLAKHFGYGAQKRRA